MTQQAHYWAYILRPSEFKKKKKKERKKEKKKVHFTTIYNSHNMEAT